MNGKPKTYDVTNELSESCESVLPDMMQIARDLIVGFDPEFQNELRQNIVLAGGGSQIRGLAEEIRSNLTEFGTCRVSAVEDPVYAGAAGALSLAMDMPESEWRRHSTSGS